ncbi:uncharacterized protein LOC127243519 isoform X2 [Andrographis paniculata]|uniref:uncharacterized protein LOC127243519 isoform X2 n=1 Tax=Andrographis paniculata TaxID=175694 RepID=UPI0021E89407|nr:uncharacterized protein LOC127243519 isoform X2 [Andrographis paniculata]
MRVALNLPMKVMFANLVEAVVRPVSTVACFYGKWACFEVNSDGERTAPKRSRKKKTLVELRDEERSLLKEKRELKRDIAALRLNLQKERTANEKLKRMKIESQPLPDREPEESNLDQLQQITDASSASASNRIFPTISSNNGAMPQSSTPDVQPDQRAGGAADHKFVLPDLNLPLDENPYPEAFCGFS